jgi:hypothetical protein
LLAGTELIVGKPLIEVLGGISLLRLFVEKLLSGTIGD